MDEKISFKSCNFPSTQLTVSAQRALQDYGDAIAQQNVTLKDLFAVLSKQLAHVVTAAELRRGMAQFGIHCS